MTRPYVRIRLALTCAALFLALSLLQAGASHAAPRGKHPVVQASTGVQGLGPTPANYDISCPQGLKAVGGGFASTGIVVSGSLVPGGGPVAAVVPVVFESRRLDLRTWRVSARAAVNPATASLGLNGTTITAVANCRKVRGGVTAVEGVGAVSTTPAAPSTTDPRCPKGKVALSGGWSMTEEHGFTYPSLYESFRDGRSGWKSSAIPGTQASVALLGFVYCAKESKPPKTTSRPTQTNGVADCPRGLVAAAGGFQSQPGTVVNASESIASSATKKKKKKSVSSAATPVGTSWFVATRFPDGAQAATTVFAYCS